ncbi:MAG: Glutamyl-tRNA(Gln) amidotransferase subunit C [Chlamydiae bacterium]|nr:Glutamyl-tRNA(Gln) amidotransferase subunit C [Chlamydiota bacterium]
MKSDFDFFGGILYTYGVMSEDEENQAAYLAGLCRIKLSEIEKETLGKSLKKILSYMDLIDEIPTDDTHSCTHVLETVNNVWAEDEIGPTLDRETFLKNAPDQVGGMVKVPPIIEFET